MRLLSAVICALAISICAEASAAQPDWRVTTREGIVRVTPPGGAAHDAAKGESLEAGAVVTTGAESRAILQNGAQTITMAANSRMKVAADSTDAMTRILQDMGAILFQVDKRGAPHFRVETPLLAAVVKGTTFTVTANAEGGVVHVAEGLVEVRANNGGAAIDVPGGKTVRIDQTSPTLIVPAAAILTKESAPPPVLNYAAASGGLVESLRAAPQLASLSGAGAGTDGGAPSFGAAQTTLASVSVVGLGGEFVSALGTATGGNLGAVNLDLGGGNAVSVAVGGSAGLASLGADVGGANVAASLGNGSLANVGASVGAGGGLANVGASVGGSGGVANVGASVGGGALANVNLNVVDSGGASNVTVSLGNGLVTADAGAGGGNVGANVGVAGVVNVGAAAGGGSTGVNVGVAGVNVGVGGGGGAALGGLLGGLRGR